MVGGVGGGYIDEWGRGSDRDSVSLSIKHIFIPFLLQPKLDPTLPEMMWVNDSKYSDHTIRKPKIR